MCSEFSKTLEKCLQVDKRRGDYVVGVFLEILIHSTNAGRPGSSEVPRNPITRWDVSSTPANGIFLTKKTKK